MNIIISSDCIGYKCLECLDICPMLVFDLSDKKLVVNQDKCVGCTQCIQVCPYDAITLEY